MSAAAGALVLGGRLRCRRCGEWRPLARFAARGGPPSRLGRAWCCGGCAPHAEHERACRDVPAQLARALPEPERDPAAVVFD